MHIAEPYPLRMRITISYRHRDLLDAGKVGLVGCVAEGVVGSLRERFCLKAD